MAHNKVFILLLLSYITFSECLLSFQVNLSNEKKRLLNYSEEAFQNFAEQVSSKGYNAEEYSVTTKDGYILTITRANNPSCKTLQKVPVILNHANFLNADSFIVAGEDTGLGYLLIKSCYDVWAATCRGTNYGRNHVSLNPNTDAEFWNYGLDEIAAFDNTAIIDYVVEKTGSAKINWVGHSHGGNTILLTLAENPEYNDKVGVVIALHPATIIKGIQSQAQLIYTGAKDFQDLFTIAGVQEILSKGGFVNTALEFLCQSGRADPLCSGIYTQLGGNSTNIDIITLRKLFSNAFVGLSVKQAAHYGQLIESGLIAKYDYGTAQNAIIYGTETPALYNLDNVKAPVVLVTGLTDLIIPYQNVIQLGGLLPSLLETVIVDKDDWNHIDPLYNDDIPTVLFPTVDKYLSQYNDATVKIACIQKK